MVPIKELLPVVYQALVQEYAQVIAETDSNPDRWYELFVAYPNDEGTQTVHSALTFEKVYSSVQDYIEEYGFDKIHIDIWKNPDNPEQADIQLDISKIAKGFIHRSSENNTKEKCDKKQVILGYADSGDLVLCTWCSKIMLVPTGADKCPSCYYEGALSWFDENNKEATYSELEKNKRYSVQSKNELEPAEYLSDETLIGEFDMNPNPLFKNPKQE